MRRWGLFGLLALCSCAFSARGRSPLLPAPQLRVEFDSVAAAARLHWAPVTAKGFLAYEVQRAVGADEAFTRQAQLDASRDTAWTDEGLRADQRYQYRVVVHLGARGRVRTSLSSPAVEGGIHRQVASWALPAGFLPTRLATDARGTVCVVGAGAGWVARFDPAGAVLDPWTFATRPLACLETGVLDAAALACDSQGALYVAYNLLEEGRSPSAWWTKFDRRGQALWTRPLTGIFARHLAIGPGDRVYIESIDRLHQFDTEGQAVAEHVVPPLLVASLRFWRDRFAILVEPVNALEMGWQAPKLMVYDSPELREAEWSAGREPLALRDAGLGVLDRPSDFAVDEDGDRAFIVNAGQGRIEVFRRSRYLTNWGREGTQAGAFRFAGEVAVVDDMATGRLARRRVVAGGIARSRDGYLYVADTFNDRVQVFQP